MVSYPDISYGQSLRRRVHVTNILSEFPVFQVESQQLEKLQETRKSRWSKSSESVKEAQWKVSHSVMKSGLDDMVEENLRRLLRRSRSGRMKLPKQRVWASSLLPWMGTGGGSGEKSFLCKAPEEKESLATSRN